MMKFEIARRADYIPKMPMLPGTRATEGSGKRSGTRLLYLGQRKLTLKKKKKKKKKEKPSNPSQSVLSFITRVDKLLVSVLDQGDGGQKQLLSKFLSIDRL